MKKIFVLLLATAMIFALAACGATPNGTDNNNTQDDHQAETPDASYEAPQITELYNEDFDYTDGVGNSGHYTYHVPQIEADTQVSDLAIGFNVNYLLDALSALREEHVVIQLRDSNSSALVREAGSEKSRHVVMPLRL